MPERTLWYAAWSGDLRLARDLLAAGVDPDEGEDGKTPLVEAVDEPGEFFDEIHEAIAGALIAAGANVAAQDEHGWTALHYAARAHVRAVELLLASGADAKVAADDGASALHEAAAHGNVPAIRALVAAGADPHQRTAVGDIPLDVARREHRPDEAPELFELLGTD